MRERGKRILAIFLAAAMLTQQSIPTVLAAGMENYSADTESDSASFENQSNSEMMTNEPESEAPESEAVSEASISETETCENEPETEIPESETGTEAFESQSGTENHANEPGSEAPEIDADIITVNDQADALAAEGNEPSEEENDTDKNKEDAEATVSISSSVTWNDNEDQAEERPNSIRLHLVQHYYDADAMYMSSREIDGATLKASNGWRKTFDNLPKYNENGQEYSYSISPENVPNYTAEVNGCDVTYTYIAEPVETIDISGSVTWNDGDNADGMRPSSVTVYLMADDKQYVSTQVTETDDWEWSIDGVPKYDSVGNEISYTVSVWSARDYYYTPAIEGYDIFYTYIGPYSISGTIIWNDFYNHQNTRPESVTVYLMNGNEVCASQEATEPNISYDDRIWYCHFDKMPLYDSAGNAITYTLSVEQVPGYTAAYDGVSATLTHENTTARTNLSGSIIWNDNNNAANVRPTGISLYIDGISSNSSNLWVTGENGWKWTLNDLPTYNWYGTEISYQAYVSEWVTDYTITTNGNDIILTYSPDNRATIAGKIIWQDENNTAGKRPDSVTVQLWNKDKNYYYVINASAGANWEWNLGTLRKYDEIGRDIPYEASVKPVPGYAISVNGYNITLTYVGETNISGQINWKDDNNSAGKRPYSATVTLTNGTEVCGTYQTDESKDWKWDFGAFPQYDENGTEIPYAISVNTVSYYAKEIDGYNITFTPLDETVEVRVKVIWDGIEGSYLTRILLTDGNTIYDNGYGYLSEWTFSGLPKYRADGSEIQYTVTVEDVPENYKAVVDGYNVTFTSDDEPETVNVSGKVAWEDDDNKEGKRPDTVSLTLYGYSYSSWSKYLVKQIAVTEETGWSYAFENLPKYKDGYEVPYTISVEEVPYYQETINGYDVSFTQLPRSQTKAYNVVVTWDDQNNLAGIRPDNLTIYAMKGNTQAASARLRLTADKNAFYFENALVLPKYEDGQAIDYRLKCEDLDGYTVKLNKSKSGWFIVLTANNVLSGALSWDDEDNQDGKRPRSVTIRLMNGDTIVAAQTVTEEDEWEWTFDTIKKYDENGTRIPYTVVAEDVPGYEKRTDDGEITFVYEPETISVNGSINWNDGNNQDGKRPESITVHLMNGETEIEEETVTEEDGWKWVFEDLPKYEAGEEISYAVITSDVPDYTVQINRYDISFIHIPETETSAPETETPISETETPASETETPISETKTPTPETKSEKAETKTGKTESQTAEAVRTGDATDTMLYVLLLMTSAFAGLSAMIYRKRRL